MIAYKLFSACPVGQKPVGIPEVWPWQMASIAEEHREQYESSGWTVVSGEEYDAYLALHQADFDAWGGPVIVPLSITARQIRLAMLGSGTLLSEVQPMLDLLDEPMKSMATISWEYASEFYRDDPILVALAPLLNITEQQIDALFIAGADL